jgi:hypothetical protein
MLNRTLIQWTLPTLVVVGLAALGGETVLGRQGCVTGFTPSSVEVPASGTSGLTPVSFTVETATSNCTWTYTAPPVSPVVFWVGPPSVTSGVGSRVISLAFVWPNNDGSPRSMVLTFGGRPITVTQAGNSCPLTLTPAYPPGVTMPANGGQGTFTVFTDRPSCSYSVQPGAGVTIVSGGSGTVFPATVTFAIPPNRTSAATGYAASASSTGGFGPTVPTVVINQNGPPATTDAPAPGLAFAVHRSSAGPPHVSRPEPLRITNAEDPSASWNATTSDAWLVLSPSSGAGPGLTTVSVDAAAAALLARGSYLGRITILSSVAPETPRRVDVRLDVTDETSPAHSMFGVFEPPPGNGASLSGAVPLGGWVLSSVGVRRVQIYRNAVPGETPEEIYVGDATRVRGARPDVAAGYALPEAMSAGWGFMLLSNVLPNHGNGPVTFWAYAEDVVGTRVRLGQPRTITFDNTNSPFPFGTIDVPTQGGAVSGTAAAIQGWVLAQPGRSIPFDGSTIRLNIDGALQPHAATYGVPRPDVAAYFPFPTYANANGAGAQFVVDTTQFADGLHTIAWQAIDNNGVAQGIGSRYFSINNGSASQMTEARGPEARSAAAVRALPQTTAFVWNRQGFDERSWSLQFAGGRTNEIRQAPGERLEVTLDTWVWSKGCGPYAGYLMTGDVAGPLPPGASIDGEKGVFSWLPPAEFGGTFELVFVRQACSGREERIPLRVTIAPK